MPRDRTRAFLYEVSLQNAVGAEDKVALPPQNILGWADHRQSDQLASRAINQYSIGSLQRFFQLPSGIIRIGRIEDQNTFTFAPLYYRDEAVVIHVRRKIDSDDHVVC